MSTEEQMASEHQPLLSIVVPFYNVQAYIGECLTSLQNQLLQDVEIILVDDGSPDGSLKIAEEFAEQDPRFRIVRQENQGLGPARNTGTKHARGKYLTFVDSDDVVAPRAYTSMVGTLETTGSAFAAGNAFRFNTEKGVYQSWTHREPFRTTKLRTNINRFVDLMKDRMVWNKVYRRTFWDAHGLEFPAIKYEDYPVTLRAYLEADSVDVLSEHVYFWRDRESGDSITQQSANADNARERYVSARSVLDMLAEHEASDEVRQAVQGYFIHIDLVSLAQSMVSVPADRQEQVQQMALELAHILPVSAGSDATRLARLMHRNLLSGDLQLVRHLASWRLTGDTRTLARTLSRHPRPLALPMALGAILNRERFQNPARPRRLRSQLIEAVWEGPILRLTVQTKLRGSLAQRVTPSARLAWGDSYEIPLRTTASPQGDGLRFTVEADAREFVNFPDDWKMAHFHLDLRLQALRWTGRVFFTPSLLPGIHQLSDGSWVQLRGIGVYLGIERVFDPIVVRSVLSDEEGFRLVSSRSATAAPLVVHRPDPTPDLPVSFTEGVARLDAAELVEGDPPDNTITQEAERPIVRYTDAPLPHLRPSASLHEDDYTPPVGEDYAFFAGEAASVVVKDRKVSLTRGWYGTLVVRQEPVLRSSPEPKTLEAQAENAIHADPEDVTRPDESDR